MAGHHPADGFACRVLILARIFRKQLVRDQIATGRNRHDIGKRAPAIHRETPAAVPIRQSCTPRRAPRWRKRALRQIIAQLATRCCRPALSKPDEHPDNRQNKGGPYHYWYGPPLASSSVLSDGGFGEVPLCHADFLGG